MWSHVYRKTFHAGVDTDNLVEAFNNAFLSRYLKLQHEKTAFSLVQVLTDIVFPEQARDYTIAVAQQTNAYRVSHYNIPDFLHDQPHLVQAECLANVQGQ